MHACMVGEIELKLTGLSRGVQYQVQVCASNERGDGPFSGSAFAVPRLGLTPPNALHATAVLEPTVGGLAPELAAMGAGADGHGV